MGKPVTMTAAIVLWGSSGPGRNGAPGTLPPAAFTSASRFVAKSSMNTMYSASGPWAGSPSSSATAHTRSASAASRNAMSSPCVTNDLSPITRCRVVMSSIAPTIRSRCVSSMLVSIRKPPVSSHTDPTVATSRAGMARLPGGSDAGCYPGRLARGFWLVVSGRAGRSNCRAADGTLRLG